VGAIKSLNKPVKIDSTIYGNVLQTSSGILTFASIAEFT
jgi:hypothetical protein